MYSSVIYIICCNNVLSPAQRQVIISISGGLLLIEPMGCEIWMKYNNFHSIKWIENVISKILAKLSQLQRFDEKVMTNNRKHWTLHMSGDITKFIYSRSR